MRKILTSALLTLALLSAVGVALYLAGVSISGNMTATGGSSPDSLVISNDVMITSTTPQTFQEEYFNSDGTVVMTFVCSKTLVSGDANCNIDPNADYLIEIWDGADWLNCNATDNPTQTINSGNNMIEYRVVPHENRCPLTSGSAYEILGTV